MRHRASLPSLDGMALQNGFTGLDACIQPGALAAALADAAYVDPAITAAYRSVMASRPCGAAIQGPPGRRLAPDGHVASLPAMTKGRP